MQTRLEELVQKRQESQKQYAVIKEQTEQKEKERQVLEKETKDLQKQQRALPDAEKETEYVLTVKAEQEKARHLQQEIEEQEKQCRIYKKEQAERKEELEICQKEKQIWEKRYLEHLASILALEPVSYTHLDVYKRQAVFFMILTKGRQAMRRRQVRLRVKFIPNGSIRSARGKCCMNLKAI